jgi:hypothetical protein
MPGLLRGIARVGVAAGTATAVSNRVSRRQAQKWSDQGQTAYQEEAPDAAPPPQAAQPDPIERLKQLGQLHTDGVLTDEEFAAEKAKVLAS